MALRYSDKGDKEEQTPLERRHLLTLALEFDLTGSRGMDGVLRSVFASELQDDEAFREGKQEQSNSNHCI